MNRHLPPYMPYNENELMKWFDNYFKNLPAYAATFQIDSSDIELEQGIYNNVLKLRSILNSLFDYRKAMTELKNQLLYNRNSNSVPVPRPENIDVSDLSMLAGLVWLVDQQNKEIMANPAYNDTIGKDLGLLPIVKPEPTPDQLVAGPTITCTGHNVEIFTVITPPADSYAIYVDKHDGKGMAFVDSSTTSHYPHNTELPLVETLWTYKIALRVARQESGTAAYMNLLVKKT